MIPEAQADFLFTSLYEGARNIEPTESNKQMIKGLCNNMGWNQDIRDYLLEDIGADYIED